MQKEDQPTFPLLYSLQGYQYCDLLLGKGAGTQGRGDAGTQGAEEAKRRAEQTLEVG